MNKAKTEVFRYIVSQNRSGTSFLTAIWLILMLPAIVENPSSSFVWVNAAVLAFFDINLLVYRRKQHTIEDDREIAQRAFLLINHLNALYWGGLIAYVLYDPAYVNVRFSAALMLAFSTIAGFYVWLISRFAGRLYMILLFAPSIAVLIFSGELSAVLSAAFILFSLVIIVQQGDNRAKLFLASAQQQVTLAEQADRYKKISNLDALTKTNNRRYFDKTLPTELDKSLENEDPISLLVIDIDHFKRVNDNHGHAAGDSCLKHSAALVRQEIRSDIDILCRYGGEEFTLILPNCPHDAATNIASRICQAFRDHPLDYQGTNITFTVSIGCASVQSKPCSDKALFELADKALYEAKERGRNQVISKKVDDEID
ncbi:MAG: diguanylate cyclase [Agarilytica sp.]